MIRITKDVLRQLQAAVGKLDTDSGKVSLGFIGRLEMSDRLYHGDLRWAEVGDDPPKDTVSIQAILSPDSSAKPVKHAKPDSSFGRSTKSTKSAKPAEPDELTDMEK